LHVRFGVGGGVQFPALHHEDENIPEDPDVPELKLVLTALKMVFRKDITTKITEILEELKPLTNDPIIKDIVRTVWHYLVYSAAYSDQDYEILYEAIKKVVEAESMPTMLEKAEARGQAKAVLTTLRKRFKNVPEGIEESVLAMSDPIALESLLETALDSDTLDEFAEVLK